VIGLPNDPRRGRAAFIAIAVTLAGALLVPLALAARGERAPATAAAAVPSFAKEVAPIIRGKCASCHRLGGIAPFAFGTEAEVARQAALIVAAVGDGRMPPWPPGRSSPHFVGQDARTLSATQRQTVLRWARAQLINPGAPRKRTPVGTPPTLPAQARSGEALLALAPASPYKPVSRNKATDDYRCFLLDPGLAEDSFVTSTRIEPGVAALVHHVILFRVTPESVTDAERLDREAPGQGWTCFGGTGVRQGGVRGATGFLDSAGWISAWAPGSRGDRQADGTGVLLKKGSRIVMQVHYNLLNGIKTDETRALLTTVPATTGLTPVETTLLPAPVELACAKGEQGPLCDRTAAQFEQIKKYGPEAGLIPTGLLALCAKDPSKPPTGPVSTCVRTLERPTTIRSVAGHMHLLGTSIRIELNPGTDRAKLLLEIPRWDFHWQGAYVLARPVEARAGDVVRVTCRFDASRRTSAKPRTAPRYTLWGEGTTDEMCLGILQVTRT
jgi:mono/diheme cytochrome c family protein